MANAFDGSEFDHLGPEAQALIRRREAVLAPSYRLFYRHPVVAVRGSGVWLYDADGNQYLDAYNNVPAVGHSHPHVQRLVNEQLGVLNTHTRYLTEPVITYSERLLDLFPPELTKVVYTCTGSEAVDLALRIARYEPALRASFARPTHTTAPQLPLRRYHRAWGPTTGLAPTWHWSPPPIRSATTRPPWPRTSQTESDGDF